MKRPRRNSLTPCPAEPAALGPPPNAVRDGCPDPRDETITRLQEAVTARDHFLAVAVHELRNPLTALQMCIELMRRAEHNGDREHLGPQLDHLALLLQRFVKRTTILLNVAQLTSDKLQVELSDFNLSQLITEVISDNQALLQRSGSRLLTEIEPDLIVRLDPSATSQIVENLLSNAIKYGLGQPIELCVNSRRRQVVIAVRDHGIGIDAEDLDRIFQPFERAVARGFRAGFGLGLWVTRQLADAMGGSIDAAGNKGHGSTFTVTLPSGGKNP